MSVSSLSTFSSTASPPPQTPAPVTPSKRALSIAFSDHSPLQSTHPHHHSSTLSDISSDTSGSVPGTPLEGADDIDHAEQVTVCRWDGCDADQGNMDHLVKHIHDDHIGTRRAKYACEWDDCPRKGLSHASGYALRAHMRSHTKEKPFYCTLPECDRSFTRSDALAKHMRTVHETEALRPSDPIPKSHPNHPQNIANAAYAESLSRRRGYPSNSDALYSDSDNEYDDGDGEGEGGRGGGGGGGRGANGRKRKNPWYLPEDGFDGDEEKKEPRELLRLLKRKVRWAELENGELEEALRRLEKRRRESWIKKEVLLDRVFAAELGEEEALELSLDL